MSCPGDGMVVGADGMLAEGEWLVGLCRMGAQAHQDPGRAWSHRLTPQLCWQRDKNLPTAELPTCRWWLKEYGRRQHSVEILGMVWISWGTACQDFHVPPQEDSQAAVVYIALCFREDVLVDEAWKWDQLLPLWLWQLFLTWLPWTSYSSPGKFIYVFTDHILVFQGFCNLYLEWAMKCYEGNCYTRVVVVLSTFPSMPDFPVQEFPAVAVLTVQLHGCQHLQIGCE